MYLVSPSKSPTLPPTRERMVIWHQAMNNTGGISNWTNVASTDISLMNDQTNDDWEDCPFPYEPCWSICGQSQNRDDAYMYRIASTEGYEQIELTYSIDPYYVWESNQYCEIRYVLDSSTIMDQSSLVNRKYDSNDVIIDETFAFDENVDNNGGLTIFLFANTGDPLRCCRIREWKLTGIAMLLTSIPSKFPSDSPSLSPTSQLPTS